MMSYTRLALLVILAFIVQWVLVVRGPPLDWFFRFIAAGALVAFTVFLLHRLWRELKGAARLLPTLLVGFATVAGAALAIVVVTPYGTMGGAWVLVRIGLVSILGLSVVLADRWSATRRSEL